MTHEAGEVEIVSLCDGDLTNKGYRNMFEIRDGTVYFRWV